MKENNAAVLLEVGPDLFIPPHVLTVLMELFMGESQQALLQQEHVLAHLAVCHYCCSSVAFLLAIAQEYDRRNNDPEEPAHALFVRFAHMSRMVEEPEPDYEQLGVYAEAIVAEGQDKADLHFPGVVAHLRTCPDCHLALDATVAFIATSEGTD